MPNPPAPAPRGQTAPRPGAGAPAAARNVAESGAAASATPPPGQLLAELKVSGHLMTLEDGLYCIVQTPAKGAAPGIGLPGVRLSQPPGAASRPEAVTIAGYRPDGWLASSGDAALVRVRSGPAQLLVTVYQAPGAGEGAAPNLQVMRLLDGGGSPAPAAANGAPAAMAPREPAAAPAPRAEAPVRAGPQIMEMVAHIQERGDVGSMLGDWLGERGSRRWIEGFGVSPTREITPKDIEYQGVLGQGWLSPWVEGGQFCGSRAMALPLLGLRVRLRGAAAETFDVAYAATFIDGSAVGPVSNGAACEADSLAAMEAFQIVLRRRGAAADANEAAPAAARPARGKAAKPAPLPEPEPLKPAKKSAAKAGVAKAEEPKGGKAPSGRKR